MKVINKRYFESEVNTYDLTIKDNHNYMITNSDIIVHNSGKGFALDNMIAFEGKHLDVDHVKEQLLKFKPGSDLDNEFFKKYGKHLEECNLKNDTDVSNLHEFTEEKQIAKKINNKFFKEQALLKNKANVIFDVTLKNYPKYEDIIMLAMLGGYKLENIHVVWVLNNVETAKKQNAARDRNVKEDILVGTHKGVAKFMKHVFSINQEYFNNIGDIYILFTNTEEKDNKLIKNDTGGKFMDYINYIKIKSAGENMIPFEQLMNKEIKSYNTDDENVVKKELLRDKINRYIPAECDKF